MKAIQKLEICLGFATPIAALLYIYFGFMQVFLERVDFQDVNFKIGITFGEISAIILLTFVFFFSLLVAFGAYYDATGSEIAADVLYFSGSVVIALLGYWGFWILIYGGIFYGLLVYSPVILSAMTMILAFFSREKVSLTIK